MGSSLRLSKSKYTSGLQCHKQLWWRVHEPDAPELTPDAATQALFDQGTRVGALARERVPGGVLIDFPHTATKQRLAATKAAIEGGARAIYEASFLADDTFAAVDILERIGSEWRLIEVKSGTKVKDEHLPDVALQLHVLRSSGLRVREAQLMHLNRECVFPRLENLFARTDVTARAEALLPEVPGRIREQLRMLAGPLPQVAIGEHCETPYPCPFVERCFPPRPEHHVSTLYYVGRKKWDLEREGYETIADLPDGFPFHPAAARQRRAVLSGRRIVEPGLGAALTALAPPVAVIDFETVGLAVPAWPGCRPFDAVPAQFSCHAQDGRGEWVHHAWLAEGPEDPRPELIRRLADACREARTIVAYNAGFERSCLERTVRDLPGLAAPVGEILERLVDALPIVRDHVYDPGFGGGFGLKSVLPALVPELDYEELEIADGTEASRELERLLVDSGNLTDIGRARLREALGRYCALDTWGVVRLLDRLHTLVAEIPARGR